MIAPAIAPLLAAASGLALLAAHPPLGWWPLSFLAPALFAAALFTDARAAAAEGRRVRGARLGAVMGLATFAPMLSWLILPAGFVGWGLLVAVQVAWFALLGGLAVPFLAWRTFPLVAAVLWTGVDAWRAIWPLNGFEWGAIAYAHVDGSWLLPTARLVGGRGITLLVVLIGVAAACVVRSATAAVRDRDGAPVEDALTRTNLPVALLVAGLLVSVLATIEPPATEGSIEVLAVQGNDRRHWEDTSPDPDPPLRITTALRDETARAIAQDGVPDLTVWPESSIDRDPFREGSELRPLAAEAAALAGTLLTGVSLDGDDEATERRIGALLLQDGFEETDRYIKRRLVPFGEYIPARALLDWFPPLQQIPRDAVPGEGPQPIDLPDGTRIATIICFETKFQDIVRDNVLADGDRPAQVLMTLTNDASFGDSAEPQQHLAQSQLRAVETGRWVVHAALTGSSAFIDPDGRLHQETEVFTIDSIRATVPLVDGLTPYLVIGDVLGWLVRGGAVLALAWLVVGRWQRRELAAPRER
ncbi:MAG: apolipoprotein N-acyltransferase [Nitriliruptoraceae bacterium]|nr:apolipoprotein N-acyltransferase [Nitriliruptoraceae bacterium]